MDITTELRTKLLNLKEKSNARAVVLLNPTYLKGETSHIAGVKTPEVMLSIEQLTEYLTEFAAATKEFLKNIRIDDETAPRTIYISTEERRVYLFRFYVKTKQAKMPFSIFLGLTVKKDIDVIKMGKENPWDIPQYVFDNGWSAIKEIQEIYSQV